MQTYNSAPDPSIRTNNIAQCVPGNWTAPDCKKEPNLMVISRGDTMWKACRTDPMVGIRAQGGMPFVRSFAAVNDLKASVAKQLVFCGIATNPGMSKGVLGSPLDPIGNLQVGGTHEVCNTGAFTIFAKDFVYGIASAWTIPASPDGPIEECGYKPRVKIYGHNSNRMLMQLIPLPSSDMIFNIQAQRDFYRKQDGTRGQAIGIEKLFYPVNTAKPPSSDAILAAFALCTEGMKRTPYGDVPGMVGAVLLDLILFAWNSASSAMMRGSAATWNPTLQTIFEAMASALQKIYGEIHLSDMDADHWRATITRNLPIDPKYNFKGTPWNKEVNMPKGRNATWGQYMVDLANKTSLLCLGHSLDFQQRACIGQALDQAISGGSFMLFVNCRA